ncbi:hydantoinase/oxoprolinase N-terminal domain-containing protein, partial [Kibdelosporangium lantanae]
MRIGIDVGGTNTDAVLLATDNTLLASVKTPTTPDVTGGVAWAVTDLLAAAAASGAIERIAWEHRVLLSCGRVDGYFARFPDPT